MFTETPSGTGVLAFLIIFRIASSAKITFHVFQLKLTAYEYTPLAFNGRKKDAKIRK